MLDSQGKIEALAREAAARKTSYGALVEKLTPLQEAEIYRRAERRKTSRRKKKGT